MDIAPLISAIITLVGAGVGALSSGIGKRLKEIDEEELKIAIETRRLGSPRAAQVERETFLNSVREVWRRIPPGLKVLSIFAIFVSAFGVMTLWRYWSTVQENQDLLFFAFWLFLTMVFGMFVQVFASNYRSGKPLFDVTVSRLTFPLLFSLIVYYPIWAIAASAPGGLFPFYAAFLNGYFWESVVSAAQLPAHSG